MSRRRCTALLVAFFAGVVLELSGAGAAGASPVCAPGGSGGILVGEGGRLDVFDSLAQLLPAQPQTGGGTASICQARNATESFQVEVTAGASPLTINSVGASTLSGPGGATIPSSSISLYREDYTTLTTMTDGELSGVIPRNSSTGKCTASDCRFPDALIPNVDPLFHEQRNAFPVSIPAGQDRVIWVDVSVPPGQAPGLYTGSLTFNPSSASPGQVPISLEVVNSSLPSTSSLHSVFFILRGERGFTGGTLTAAEYAEYAELGLDDRINVIPNTSLSNETGPLETYLKPLLTGSDPKVALSGAQLTDYPIETSFEKASVSPYKTVFAQAGASNRVGVYCDETSPQGCAEKVASSELLTLWPGLQVLATADAQNGWPDPNTTVVPSTTGSVNLASPGTTRGVLPVAQDVDPIEGLNPYSTLGNRMPKYSEWRAEQSGRQVWSYTSCFSGGCGSTYNSSSVWSGWPSYGIDQVATEQRAIGWQMFAYSPSTVNCATTCNGIEGEEYWSVNVDKSIWTAPYEEGMNGDGTLFYPWEASRIGGTDPIPVESIRLKRIRDGRQDFELLKLASAISSQDAGEAITIARGEFPNMDSSGPSSSSFDGSRQQLMALFSVAAPTVTKLSPAKGPVAGGTTVKIMGTNLTGANSVHFGTVAASYTVNSATSITATAPAQSAGAVNVTVTTGGGTSATSTATRFKYYPTVTGLSPSHGPAAGGTSVAVAGTGFALGTKATVIKFGTTKSPSVNCTSSTQCTAVSPAHEIGKVDVKATVNKVTSPKLAGDQFNYE